MSAIHKLLRNRSVNIWSAFGDQNKGE